MYTLLSLLLVSLLGYIKADEAITTPSNGTTITPGQKLAFRWVSEDDDADVSRFSVALISLVELGSYTPVDGGDGRRYIREQIVLPDGLRTGSYYLGINEREANENGTVLGDYDLTHAVPGDTWDSPVILEVTSSSSKRAIRRDLPTKRQSNNTNNDEMLYSPSNSTLPLGSSFNFTYRVDEDDDPSDRTESVAVSLVRYWTDIQQGSAVRQGDGTLFEGSIDIPQDLATGYYYIGVSDGDDNFTEEQTRPGSYEVTFHSDAQINGNDVDVSGPERPLILFVSGDASSVSASSTPSASGSVTASVPVTVTTTNGAGNVATSAVQSVGNNAASATGAAGKLTIPLGGVLGGLLAWAMV